MIITFFGHSTISDEGKLFEKVLRILTLCIDRERHVTFYCGGYGDFDRLCARACRAIKKQFPLCNVAFVTPYITEAQQIKMRKMVESGLYDMCVYPPLENVPPRYAIARRNEWMAKEADLVLAYVKYRCGGAYQATERARQRGKRVIQLAGLPGGVLTRSESDGVPPFDLPS